jgi:hypothetical protein
MSGSGLMDFLIVVVGLCIIVGMIFAALEFISPDVRFKTIARYAVGGAALLAFLVAIKNVLFGGSGAGVAISPVGVIEFAIGIIVILVVLFIIFWALDFFAPSAGFLVPIKYVIGAIALIAILVVAEQVLFGGGLMRGGGISFLPHQQPTR